MSAMVMPSPSTFIALSRSMKNLYTSSGTPSGMSMSPPGTQAQAGGRARTREGGALSGLAEQLEGLAGRVVLPEDLERRAPGDQFTGISGLVTEEQRKEALFLSLFDRKVEFVRAKTDPQKIEAELGADERSLRDLQRRLCDYHEKFAIIRTEAAKFAQ